MTVIISAFTSETKQDLLKWKTGADGLVYLVNNHKLAWEDAKQFCEKRSGKLVVIPNEHVRDSLKDLLRNQEDALYWTGQYVFILPYFRITFST